MPVLFGDFGFGVGFRLFYTAALHFSLVNVLTV